MSDENLSTQEEEIQTLQSIYLPGELSVSKSEKGTYKLVFFIDVAVPENYRVCYVLNEKDGPRYLNVKYLSPIKLVAYFVKKYPSSNRPCCKLRSEWLSQTSTCKLTRSLHDLWDQNFGFPIIYTWVEFIKNEALQVVGMQEELDLMDIFTDNNAQPSNENHSSPQIASSSNENHSSRQVASSSKKKVKRQQRKLTDILRIVHSLEVNNMEKEQLCYLNSYHYCEICCGDKLGKDSTSFEPCKHIFCNECLKGYFTSLVNEGSSCAVKCPGFKCTSEAAQYQVRQLLPPELFEKYDAALLATMLDSMNDIVYCPRPKCQYPVTWDREERMAVCPQCQYAFCIHCRMGYHGIEPCKYSPEQRQQLIESYQNATVEEKEVMETRYGKRHLTTLIDNFLSEGWMEVNGKRCPKCNIVIEKNHGCNKMTCFRCKTPFCWLCSKILDQAHPYYHYQDSKSPCQGQLFIFEDEPDLLDIDDVEWLEQVEDSGSEDLQGEDSDDNDYYYN